MFMTGEDRSSDFLADYVTFRKPSVRPFGKPHSKTCVQGSTTQARASLDDEAVALGPSTQHCRDRRLAPRCTTTHLIEWHNHLKTLFSFDLI